MILQSSEKHSATTPVTKGRNCLFSSGIAPGIVAVLEWGLECETGYSKASFCCF